MRLDSDLRFGSVSGAVVVGIEASRGLGVAGWELAVPTGREVGGFDTRACTADEACCGMCRTEPLDTDELDAATSDANGAGEENMGGWWSTGRLCIAAGLEKPHGDSASACDVEAAGNGVVGMLRDPRWNSGVQTSGVTPNRVAAFVGVGVLGESCWNFEDSEEPAKQAMRRDAARHCTLRHTHTMAHNVARPVLMFPDRPLQGLSRSLDEPRSGLGMGRGRVISQGLDHDGFHVWPGEGSLNPAIYGLKAAAISLNCRP